jgi:hypothetical protein
MTGVPRILVLGAGSSIAQAYALSHRARLDDDPVVFALQDLTSWLLAVVVTIAIVLAI